MANGHFLGGVAEGIEGSRLLGIKEDALRNEQKKSLLEEVDKAIAGTMKIVGETIKASREAGADPEKTRNSISPLLANVSAIAQRVNKDPSPYLAQADAMLSIPSKPEAAKTELGQLREDLAAGRITPDEHASRVQRLTREQGSVELIRQKISRGETVTPGEQKVYDDAVKAEGSELMQLLKAFGVVQPKEGEPAAQSTSIPSLSATKTQTLTFSSEEEARKAFQAKKIKIGDEIIVGGRKMKVTQ